MMRRAWVIAALCVGCTFPDPPVGQAPRDSNVVTDVGDETSVEDATFEDVEVVDDAGDVAIGDASCRAPPCDCDGDGVEAEGTCGGNDCDDHDGR
jgi:hypothetical protein